MSLPIKPRTENVYSAFTARALRAGAVNLGQGFPDDPAPAAILDTAIRAISEGHNQYPPTTGVPALRQAITEHQQKYYGIKLDPDTEVVVTTGASEAITAALLAILENGDEVLIVEPAYDLYPAAIALAHAHAVRVKKVTDLAARVTKRTKVILLNSPGNPSGVMLNRADLATVGEVAQTHDLTVISDEVYEHIVLDDKPHICAAEEPRLRDRTLVISSAAKTFCVTGWKVGWATGPAHLVAALHDVKQFLSFASGTPFQLAVAQALTDPTAHVAELRAAYRQRREVLGSALKQAGYTLSWPQPQGGYFLLADASPLGVASIEDLWQHCEELPDLVGIVGIPGSVFTDGEDVTTVRFCFAKSQERVDEAAARLRAATRSRSASTQ